MSNLSDESDSSESTKAVQALIGRLCTLSERGAISREEQQHFQDNLEAIEDALIRSAKNSDASETAKTFSGGAPSRIRNNISAFKMPPGLRENKVAVVVLGILAAISALLCFRPQSKQITFLSEQLSQREATIRSDIQQRVQANAESDAQIKDLQKRLHDTEQSLTVNIRALREVHNALREALKLPEETVSAGNPPVGDDQSAEKMRETLKRSSVELLDLRKAIAANKAVLLEAARSLAITRLALYNTHLAEKALRGVNSSNLEIKTWEDFVPVDAKLLSSQHPLEQLKLARDPFAVDPTLFNDLAAQQLLLADISGELGSGQEVLKGYEQRIGEIQSEIVATQTEIVLEQRLIANLQKLR